MRYFLRINLTDSHVKKEILHHPKLEGYLPKIKTHTTSQSIFLQTFQYETEDRSIIRANWDNPFYEDDESFLFIGGHVLWRLKVQEETGNLIPSPKEIFNIIKKYGDYHYEYLKGSYYILLYDKMNLDVVIYSAPMYIYPVFFSVQSNTLVFSNFLEFVLGELPSIELYDQGLVEFTLFDHPLGINTIYKDVYSMTGGSKVDISSNSIKEQTVYDIADWIHRNPKSRKDTIQEINFSLNKILNNYTSHAKQFNISLTGGFDGRLNFSLIKPPDYKRLQAFSYGKSGSLQLSIPLQISAELGFNYKAVRLDDEFLQKYSELGLDTILLTGGLTPFLRANYLYGYDYIKSFSRNCILGQCDMIRPLYTNPAGGIFNIFSQGIFFNNDYTKFLKNFKQLGKKGYLNEAFFSDEIAEQIFKSIIENYIQPYAKYSKKEQYFLFLFKESMIKFWQTECHTVDLIVDDFISFSDLDYIELLSSSKYFGLYKGIFAPNQLVRRKAHDLYIEIMSMNNNKLNHLITDRLFKPFWLKYGLLGLAAAYIGKFRVRKRTQKVGNDTFGGLEWSSKFYEYHKSELEKENAIFNQDNFSNKPYKDDNTYRLDRHLSLKLWFEKMKIH